MHLLLVLVLIPSYAADASQVPVLTLLHALPMLSDVAILCLFAMFVFGIVAVQMFAGVMQNR